MRIRIILAAVLCATLAACGTGRLLSYGGELADAKVRLGDAEFQVYVHPKDETLLVQRSLGQISGGQDLSFEFQAAAARFLASVECRAGNATSISAGSFEVPYECDAGVELPQLVAQQRAALRAGQPLRNQ